MEKLAGFKKYLLILIDIILIAVGYFLAYFLLDDIQELAKLSQLQMLIATIYIAAITYIIVMCLLQTYNNILRFASVREYFICFSACLIASLIMCVERVIFSFLAPIRIHILAGILIAVLVVGTRVMIRAVLRSLFKNPFIKKQDKRKLLIVGAGAAGNLVVKDILKGNERIYEIVGLIDDDTAKHGCKISGVKVLGGREVIPQVCEDRNVDIILFAIPSADGKEKKEILELCSSTRCKVRVLPSVNDLIMTKPMMANFRDVDISDLLFREPIRLDNHEISQYIQNEVVLVTGGGGSIGSELCKQIAKFNPRQLVILDIYENNVYDIVNELGFSYPDLDVRAVIASVRDRARLDDVFRIHCPSVVFHAAAHKHVPLMEDNPGEAIKNNVFGTMNAAECADKYGVKKFILISTDKAVNPTNIMGATKRMCEMVIQGINETSETDFVAVRFGNVLGSNGSVIPLFKNQIAKGGPITVTHRNITRFFMTIPEAAQLVLQAAAYAAGGEIFVLDMGQPVKIYDLARNLIKLSGLEPDKDIEIQITGLRPGEKLYEELLMQEEGLRNTRNKKIFVARPCDIDYKQLKRSFEALSEVINEENIVLVKKVVSNLVPTYVTNYSEKIAEYDNSKPLEGTA